jgi:phage shock protein A
MIGKRMFNVWRAVVGSGLTELEANNAEAMLDLERLELHNKVQQYNHGLAGYAALCEKLKSEIARLEAEQQRLEPKLRSRLDAGDRAGAGRHALRLEAVGGELAQHRAQRQEAEGTYKELVRAREVALVAARDRIESLKRGIGELKVQQALADLTELAAGMHGSIGISDGTLERIQERVEDKRNFAKGRVRVARDAFDSEDVRQREAEQAASAEAALRRYEGPGASPKADP